MKEIMKENLTITEHAIERMKERCGFKRRAAVRMAYKAYNDGISHRDLTGTLRRWVDGIYLSQKKANNIKIYGNFAYLFHFQTLITVMCVPKGMVRSLNEIREELK